MKLKFVACLLALTPISLAVSATPPASPYVGQEGRAIKSLSAEDVNGYLSGKGMGFAKAAELNGYAGPAHVLELVTQLGLTPEQQARTQALFAAMESKAISLGRRLIEEERKLDRLFATKSVTPPTLSASLSEIGALRAKLRGTHLEAHLAQVEILTREQNVQYARLRGYGNSDAHGGRGTQHQH